MPDLARRLRPTCALLVALACLVPAAARAQEAPSAPPPGAAVAAGVPIPRESQVRALKQLRRDLLWLGARRHMAEARELRAAQRRASTRHGRRPGAHARPVEEGAEPAAPPLERTAGPAALEGLLAIPTNVRVNNTTGDTANAGQAEESIASLGSNVLVAWNDGQGFRRPTTDTQAAAWSVNGGSTWTKVAIPHPAAWPSWRWYSDPVVTVDEKTGRFYYCGMATANSTTNAIGVAYGHFAGSSFAWDGVSVVRTATTATTFLDKPWCVADSSTGYVYVTQTTFDGSTNRIDFCKSSDAGATWSAAVKVSSAAEDGSVQGSRPCVGPTGTVYVTWMALGPFLSDYLRIRTATARAASWGSPVTVDSVYAQYGTGGPGFNREKGITFPSIAVDRTPGLHRGRVYLAWNETWNISATSFTLNTGQVEVEPNNAAQTATLFTPGQTLRGQISSTSDPDWWKFALTAGQSVVVWVDSMSANMTYVCRVHAPGADSSQRLCYGGDLSNPSRTVPLQTFYQFTAPAAGTYSLRIAPLSTSTVGRYRIQTAYGAGPGGYRARDQRDVFVEYADPGDPWSAPQRVNDDPVGYDDFLPEVTVGSDGAAYVEWLDFRNDTYGSRAHQYVARSPDGDTWQANQRLTSSQGNFTTCLSNLMPNEGDYSHVWADARYVRPVWADARGSNVDVWGTSFDTWFTLTSCAGSRNVNVNTTVNLSWTITNQNAVFPVDFPWTLTNARGWPVTSSGTFSLGAGASGVLTVPVTVPDSAGYLSANAFHFAVASGPAWARTLTCDATLTVTGPLAVEPGAWTLSLAPARPNPSRGLARLRYTLPAAARTTLRIYGPGGEVVRTLEDGTGAAGEHERAWDGRDDRGRPVASGVYFVRLEVAGRALSRRFVWMR